MASKNFKPTPSQARADYHETVLLRESVEALLPREGRVIVDCTLGGGGHTELLLMEGATVYGIDQDADAWEFTAKRLAPYGDKFQLLKGNFADIDQLLLERGIDKVDGILADLGVSSQHLDAPERGFSHTHDGPLDMRMDQSAEVSAYHLVNEWSEVELAKIFWELGEEKLSRKVARHIVGKRSEKAIETTKELSDIVGQVLPKKSGKNPATKVFQALRMEVNRELNVLKSLLEKSVSLLNSKGRVAIITFHSLEDRMVKQFFKKHSQKELDRLEWPAPKPNPEYYFDLINRKPLEAGDDEKSLNRRSRSAKLRVAERIQPV